jgi:hypothetical protein
MMILFNRGEAPFSFLTPPLWGRGGLWVKGLKGRRWGEKSPRKSGETKLGQAPFFYPEL